MGDQRRKGSRSGRPGKRKSASGTSLRVYGSLAVLAAGIGFLLYAAKPASGSHHPTPREGITAANVMQYTRYARIPRIEKIYREAAQVPEALDGIYCYCHCIENMGHYSLLTCFESDHASGCDVCLSEGDMVYRMTQQGRSLDQIRQAIDRTFST